MLTTEGIQGKEAVSVIVAVKKTAFLLSVDWIVSGVQINDDLLWRNFVRSDKDFDEKTIDFHRAMAIGAILKAAQCGAACEWTVALTNDSSQQRIVAQGIVIVEILVGVGDPKDPLTEHVEDGMLNEGGIAIIGNELRDPSQEIEVGIGLGQQDAASVRRDVPALEVDFHWASL